MTTTVDGDSKTHVEPPSPKRFYGTVALDPVRLTSGGERGDSALHGDQGADVLVTLDIRTSLPDGTPEHVVRTVSENCRALKFQQDGFEDE